MAAHIRRLLTAVAIAAAIVLIVSGWAANRGWITFVIAALYAIGVGAWLRHELVSGP